MQFMGMSFKDTASEIRKILGVCKMEAVKTEAPDLEKRKERLASILKGCKRITHYTVAAQYFASRCITEVPESDCFTHPALDYFDSDGKRQGAHPAIVSRIRTPTGEISSFQILYLTEDGKKLNTTDCRKILPVIAPMKGGAIRLYAATDILCIAEGLESAMSVRIDTGMPVWSAINAGNMESIIIPESVKHVYIFADSDDTFTGQKSAYALARRIRLEGVRETVNVINLIDQEQVIDSGVKYDMNDYIILQSAE
jgi:putative DNA primase/helicase